MTYWINSILNHKILTWGSLQNDSTHLILALVCGVCVLISILCINAGENTIFEISQNRKSSI